MNWGWLYVIMGAVDLIALGLIACYYRSSRLHCVRADCRSDKTSLHWGCLFVTTGAVDFIELALVVCYYGSSRLNCIGAVCLLLQEQ